MQMPMEQDMADIAAADTTTADMADITAADTTKDYKASVNAVKSEVLKCEANKK